MAETFVPVQEIRQLTAGSYETRISQLQKAVHKESKRLFGASGLKVEILATFEDRCVAVASNGKFVNAAYKMVEGAAVLVAHESITIPLVAEADVPAFLESEAKRAVDAWLVGNKSESTSLLTALARCMPSKPAVEEKKVVEALQVELSTARPWQGVLKERSARIRSLVGAEALAALESAKLSEKYRHLAAGSIEEDKIEGFRGLVESDFGYLKDRVSRLCDLVDASLASSIPVLASRDLKEEESMRGFRSFAEDLLADTRRMLQIVSETTKTVRDVRNLGTIYDAIVSKHHDLEVAGTFVHEMAGRIVAEAKSEAGED